MGTGDDLIILRAIFVSTGIAKIEAIRDFWRPFVSIGGLFARHLRPSVINGSHLWVFEAICDYLRQEVSFGRHRWPFCKAFFFEQAWTTTTVVLYTWEMAREGEPWVKASWSNITIMPRFNKKTPSDRKAFYLSSHCKVKRRRCRANFKFGLAVSSVGRSRVNTLAVNPFLQQEEIVQWLFIETNRLPCSSL